MSGKDPVEEVADGIQEGLEGATEQVDDFIKGAVDFIDECLGVK